MTGETYLTAPQMAAVLNVSTDTIRRRANLGEIPGVRIGRQWRFSETEVRDHLRRSTEMRNPWAPSAASRRALNRRRAA